MCLKPCHPVKRLILLVFSWPLPAADSPPQEKVDGSSHSQTMVVDHGKQCGLNATIYQKTKDPGWVIKTFDIWKFPWVRHSVDKKLLQNKRTSQSLAEKNGYLNKKMVQHNLEPLKVQANLETNSSSDLTNELISKCYSNPQNVLLNQVIHLEKQFTRTKKKHCNQHKWDLSLINMEISTLNLHISNEQNLLFI